MTGLRGTHMYIHMYVYKNTHTHTQAYVYVYIGEGKKLAGTTIGVLYRGVNKKI
jgi:hypothetical protein